MGQSELERCAYKRGHYDDVTFKTPLTGLVFSNDLKSSPKFGVLLISDSKVINIICISQLHDVQTNFGTKLNTALKIK